MKDAKKGEEDDISTPKEEMIKLASSTQFGGPGYILDSTFMTERLIWLFIFLAFTTLTIRDLYNTISGYIAGPTSTDTTILSNNTMSYNGTTFCVTYNSMALDWGVELTKPKETMKVLNSFSGEDILAMLQNETQADTASNNTNLVSLIMLTTTMLGNIVRLENLRYTSMDEVDLHWGVSKANAHHVNHIDNQTTESIESVYKFYAKRDVSLVDLYPVIAKLLLRQMDTTFFCDRVTRGNRQHLVTQLPDKARITWFGRVPFGLMEERLCFKLPDGTIIFRSSAEGCTLKISPGAIYPGRPYIDIPGGVMFDLSGHNIPQGDVTNMWGISVGYRKQVDIQIMGDYTSLDRSDVPCDDDSNSPDFVDCVGKCRATKINEMCKCWPLSWWHLAERPSNARYCTQPSNTSTSSYRRRVPDLTTEECNATHFSYVVDDDCASKCKPKCRQSIYLYTEQKLDQSNDSPFNPDQSWENRTIIYMDTPSFIYPEITQSWSFDIGKCFADLGGNISLWLGGSIIGVMHIIIYSCRVAVDVRYGKEVKKKEARFRENVAKRILQGPSAERLHEEQVAFFRYELQHALRAYNTRRGGTRSGSLPSNPERAADENIVCTILGRNGPPVQNTISETVVIGMLQRLAELEKELAESKKQLAEQQRRLSWVEHMTGDHSEALGHTD